MHLTDLNLPAQQPNDSLLLPIQVACSKSFGKILINSSFSCCTFFLCWKVSSLLQVIIVKKTCRSSVPYAASERILEHCSCIRGIIEPVPRPLQTAADRLTKITRVLNRHLTDISFLGVIADQLYCSAVSPGFTLILDDSTPHDLCPLPTAMVSHEIPESNLYFFTFCEPYPQLWKSVESGFLKMYRSG